MATQARSKRLFIFRNCSVLDATQAGPRDGFDVLVEHDRIREVSERPISTSGAVELNVDGRTLMPGLIDAHAHVTDIRFNTRAMADVPLTLMTAESAGLMKAMLMRGFTTVRDAGGADWGLREAVEQDLLPGPRLFISGRALSQTGGHGDYRSREDQVFEPCICAHALGMKARIADGLPEVLRAARDELRRGADQIKVMVSGGVSSPNDPIDTVQYTAEELEAIVGQARAWRTYVLAHAYTAQAVKHAVHCGVRSIEHGNLIDTEAATMMAAKGAFMVPTLVAFEAMKRRGPDLGISRVNMEKLDEVREAGLHSLELCKAAGVAMGFGTDLPGGLHEFQSLEFSIRAQALSPHEIITSATATNAALLNRTGELGVIAPGALADLLVVEGNPLEDLNLLQDQGAHLAAIMKGGKLYKNSLRTQ